MALWHERGNPIMTFHVGQKVVCVDDSWEHVPGESDGLDGLKKGSIYTVRKAGLTGWDGRGPCLCIVEIVRRHISPKCDDAPYWERRFRPLVERETDISVFTAMLKPKLERVDQ
jgi:hypothetical protein